MWLSFCRWRDAARLVYPLRPDTTTRINLWLEPGRRRGTEVRRLAQECLGDRAEVRTVEADNDATRALAAGRELGVALGGAAALVVGLFLVYNALSVSVAERRHDIGILRSSGATRGQIVRLFVGEATLLGLAGAASGLPLGLGLGLAGAATHARTTERRLRNVVRCDRSGDFGSHAPVGAHRGRGHGHAGRPGAGIQCRAGRTRRRGATRAIDGERARSWCYTSSPACLLGGCRRGVRRLAYDQLPPRYGAYAGMTIFLLTALVATPLVAGIIGRLLQPLSRRLLSLEGRLAADNLVRSPGRTGIVIAALAATGALLVMTSGFIHSTEQILLTWIDEQIAADLFVTAGGTFGTGGKMLPMSEDIGRGRRLRGTRPEVEAALPVRLFGLDFRGRIVAMIALDSEAFKNGGGERTLARNLGRYPRIREPGSVLLSENFAALYGLGLGDRVTHRRAERAAGFESDWRGPGLHLEPGAR